MELLDRVKGSGVAVGDIAWASCFRGVPYLGNPSQAFRRRWATRARAQLARGSPERIQRE